MSAPAEDLAELLADADRPLPPAADEPIRFSRLRRMAQSPAHFAFAPNETSTSMDVGSAVHAMLLGGKRLTAFPGKVRNGKAWDQFAADNRDALILTRRELAKAEGMAKAVRADKEAMRVLDGVREQTMEWRQNGRLCRGTPDVRGAGFITELKSGETSDPRRFAYKVKQFCYHGQLAWYGDGSVLAGNEDPKDYYVVAVEAAAPHVVTVFRMTKNAIDQGRRLARLWFERLLVCEATNEWPPYVQSIVDLDLPEEYIELDEAAVAAAEPEWARA